MFRAIVKSLSPRHIPQGGVMLRFADGWRMMADEAVGSGPQTVYLEGLQRGIFRPDPRQAITMGKLQSVYDSLVDHIAKPKTGRRRPSGLTMVDSMHGSGSRSSAKPSLWSSFMGTGGGSSTARGSTGGSGAPVVYHEPFIKGLYMYGGVGCGKTMLMDIFVGCAPAEFKVVRTHFHDFMLGIHKKLRHFKGKDDQVMRVADHIMQDTRVLCLDEFFVTDVADAMILARLFGRLWDHGIVLVATSNRAPDKLYENGLQRSLFMPFIHRLKVECDAHDMVSPTDYRKLAKHQGGLYFTDPTTRDALLLEEFSELADGVTPSNVAVPVMMGRELQVPLAAGKICKFDFADLCGRPLAAADYLALTDRFHTMVLSGVPVFKAANRSEGYRFVTLIDVFYEHKIRMLISAEAPPFDLFENILTQQEAKEKPYMLQRPDVIVDDNLGFSKDRTISRLTEMQSLEFLLAHANEHAPENKLALEEAKSKSENK